MVKDNLETRAKKSVLKIEKSLSGVYNILTDFSLKLCHIIERMGDHHYRGTDPNPYYAGS